MLTLAVAVLQRCLAKESRASLAVSNELKNMGDCLHWITACVWVTTSKEFMDLRLSL
jgi:hypothetical protein